MKNRTHPLHPLLRIPQCIFGGVLLFEVLKEGRLERLLVAARNRARERMQRPQSNQVELMRVRLVPL